MVGNRSGGTGTFMMPLGMSLIVGSALIAGNALPPPVVAADSSVAGYTVPASPAAEGHPASSSFRGGDAFGKVSSAGVPVSSGSVHFFANCEDYKNPYPFHHEVAAGPITQGTYSVSHVPAGNYRVLVTSTDPTAAGTSWNGAAATCEQSPPVSVNGDTDATVDIFIAAQTRHLVTGNVRGISGTGLDDVLFYKSCEDYNAALPPVDSDNGVETQYAVFVPAGSYRVVFRTETGNGDVYRWNGSSSACETSETVAVLEEDTSVNIALAPESAVTGTVSPASTGSVFFYATCQDYAQHHPTSVASVDAGGAYATQLPNGIYRVRVQGNVSLSGSWNGAKPSCADSEPVAVNGSTTAALSASPRYAVSGTLKANGSPITQYGQIKFYASCQDYYDGNQAAWSGYMGGSTYTVSLANGAYKALVWEGTGTARSWNGATTKCEDSTNVTVSGPTTTDITADVPRTVAGSVTDSRGQTVSSGDVYFFSNCSEFRSVQHWIEQNTSLHADINAGTYSLKLANGTYRALLYTDTAAELSWHSAKSLCEQSTTVTVNGNATLDLIAAAGANVTGSVSLGTPTTPTPTPPATPTPTQSTPTPTQSTPPPPGASVMKQTTAKLAGRLPKGKSARLPKKTTQGAPLSWKTTTKKVCSVKKRKVKALKKGTCRLMSTAPAVSGFAPFNQKYSIKVK